ncbi:ketosteroid isomerase [Favolaschia claudopus]|uniref:Ketosteroid isomerase n=1 Tax=Favolaschia claudopus TaxID=2862362 RepID=A0AAW0CX19_9AGAR
MPKFTLTQEHIASLFTGFSSGDVSGVDPELKWTIGSETKDSVRLTGVYNLATWSKEVRGPLVSRLQGGVVTPTVQCVDIVGNKAIVELVGTATQLNGKPYNNRYIWILIFSEDTGKVVEIREYLDTALCQEVMQNNSPAA